MWWNCISRSIESVTCHRGEAVDAMVLVFGVRLVFREDDGMPCTSQLCRHPPFRCRPPASTSSDNYDRAPLQLRLQHFEPVAAEIDSDCGLNGAFAGDHPKPSLVKVQQDRWARERKRIRHYLGNHQRDGSIQASRHGTCLSQGREGGFDRCENHRDGESGLGRFPIRGLRTTRCGRQEFFKGECHFSPPNSYIEPIMRGLKKA